MSHRAVIALCSAATVLLSAPMHARADDPQWGLKAAAGAAAPWAQGEGRSLRLTLEPSMKWRLADVEFRVRERIRWLEQQGMARTDADVREFTASWRGDSTSLSLGAQQITWGRMDIVRVADLINPVDQHDLFVEELPQAKLARWMANWEWQDGPRSLQLLMAPRPGIDRLLRQAAGLPVQAKQPDTSAANSTWAARYGFEAGGWSADLMAVHGWQTSPSLVPVMDAGGLRLQAATSKQNSLAFSADRPLGSTVLRIEGLHAQVEPDAQAAGLGLQAHRQTTLGAGLDVRQGAWFVAGQLVAQFTSGLATGSEHTALLSAIVQRKWLQDRLAARALFIRDTRSGSSWGSLQLSFEQSANVVLQLQADRFRGDSSLAFGSLRNRSRIAASVRLQY